jgi:hypothetical protein
MGSYSVLRLGDWALMTVKSELDPTAMLLFTEADKRVWPREVQPLEDDSALQESQGPAYGDATHWDEQPSVNVAYVATLPVVRDRLEFMGYTLPYVREAFRRGRADRLEKLAKQRAAFPTPDCPPLQWLQEGEEAVLKAMTFENWLVTLRQVLKQGWDRSKLSFMGEDRRPFSLKDYITYHAGDEGLFGFPTWDFRVFLRAALELPDLPEQLVYDLTDLVEGGYLDHDGCEASYARRMLAEPSLFEHKVVVLTEGKSDIWVLERSLRLLYHHLADYYSFMDFEGVRAAGGAGPLVATIKAFIGAGIVNRTVAFFDNDTAARSAMRCLRDIPLPHNIRVLRYPEIETARTYPTLGPQGISMMDVNGLAGGLELYLGTDALKGPDGQLTPVLWRGYDEGIGAYQGEVMDKAAVQERFKEKLLACETDPSRVASYDWSGIRAILDLLRSAFHGSPPYFGSVW